MSKTMIVTALCAAAALAGAPGDAREPGEAWRAPLAPDGVQRVRIRCGPDFIDPHAIIVKAGIPVELLISAAPGLGAHSFTVSSPERAPLAARADLNPAPQALAFTPPAAGEYPLACQDDAGTAGAPQPRAKQGILTAIP